MSPSTIQWLEEFYRQKSGQATPIQLVGHLSRSMMSSSLPALPSAPSDPFCDTVDISSQPVLQLESASRGEPRTDALYGSGGCEKHHLENGILGS